MQHTMTETPAPRRGRQAVLPRRRRLLTALALTLTALGWSFIGVSAHALRLFGAAPLLGISQVYTVADVERRVARDPTNWVGRTVLVRGQAVSHLFWRAADGITLQIGLIDPTPGNHTPPLSLRWGNPDLLLVFLRRLPWVGRFAPRPQQLSWETPAIYRIQLNRPPHPAYSGEDAMLVDADAAG